MFDTIRTMKNIEEFVNSLEGEAKEMAHRLVKTCAHLSREYQELKEHSDKVYTGPVEEPPFV